MVNQLARLFVWILLNNSAHVHLCWFFSVSSFFFSFFQISCDSRFCGIILLLFSLSCHGSIVFVVFSCCSYFMFFWFLLKISQMRCNSRLALYHLLSAMNLYIFIVYNNMCILCLLAKITFHIITSSLV